jgi:hypothetical protein
LFVSLLLALGVVSNAAGGVEVLPMRTKAPLVYETPLKNAVILEFQLYDNETWCWLYLRKDVWDAIRANGFEVPADLDIGRLQCERR